MEAVSTCPDCLFSLLKRRKPQSRAKNLSNLLLHTPISVFFFHPRQYLFERYFLFHVLSIFLLLCLVGLDAGVGGGSGGVGRGGRGGGYFLAF